ncbi:MAG: hypothetical protein ACOH5I_26080 [Oligoflexus sp.]
MASKKKKKNSELDDLLGAYTKEEGTSDKKSRLNAYIDHDVSERATNYLIMHAPRYITMSKLVEMALDKYLDDWEDENGEIKKRPKGENLTAGRPMSIDR